MPDPFAALRHELAVANRILANEGIIDAFGHISARNPKDPSRYFISRHRASELVEPADILEMTLDSEPVVPTRVRLYSEMVIHGEIYKARPDVNSVCHHHAPAVLPFCATGVELVPLFHLGGTLGTKVPFWDSRDEFGDTNLLVRTPEEGASHARALGPHWMLLLRRHGASLAGKSVREWNASFARSTPPATPSCNYAPWRSEPWAHCLRARRRNAAATISAPAGWNARGNTG
jgi:ribulose-5-phosphate 4-epimerase/fuculose-1-phosphate aldolase